MNKKSKKSRSLVLYTLVVIVLFVALFAINQATNKKDNVNQTTAEAPSTASQPVMGKEDAKVSIVEFGDYKCPSCKAWGEQVWPLLKKDYIDSGKAKFSYTNVLFHGEESKLGALAGEAIFKSNPEDFWTFHKALFDAQPEVNHDGLWITEEKLLEVAKTSVPTMDLEQFQQSLKSNEVQGSLDLDQELVKQFNIKQTPTIMINNIVIANPFDYAAITAAIEQEMK
ncbi:dihydroneopterin aldolase [Paenibacillus sp. FSL A5-0031]|uniref:DsbA family protein n=1 Tax=Paenibacillus sp. FSL A5-0031 TaxID=1920420 RepID=UPI00096E5BB4|nr:DsbA family protein [Paenibacillus sp. FSL A5-0031]OME75956.1 dihydroneopterin aldolase [Paenibacillus sp. FSL A5-0031]